MKIITIGRSPDCDIVLSDNMISRRHALIKIYPSGRYELVNTGSNGTKVNGNQIAPNQPYPIKRGDSVTFAHVDNLDWNLVPNPLKPFKIGAIICAIIVVLALVWIIAAPFVSSNKRDDWNASSGEYPATVGRDSIGQRGEKVLESPFENVNIENVEDKAIKKKQQRRKDSQITKTINDKAVDKKEVKPNEKKETLPESNARSIEQDPDVPTFRY